MPDATLDLRPRTTGEVLDDAWRLVLPDAALLLLFLSLFQVPAFVLLLLLLTQSPGDRVWLLPALVGLFLPLTGIGSGACQDLFRRRLEEQPVRPIACLWAALRDGLRHAAARGAVLPMAMPAFLPLVIPAFLLPVALLGFLVFMIPAFLLWAAAAPVHALIAARRDRGGLLGELRREAAMGSGKAVAVVLVRLPLLLLAVVNLHLLLHVLLWIGENFIGLDTALLAATLSLFGNSAYILGMFLLAWLLLSPFFEATNFLLHLDSRTRQEGLDLFYRVRRVFPTAEAARVVGAIALVASFLLAGAAHAAGGDLDTIRAVRVEVGKVQEEIKTADPYPGSARWDGPLRRLASRLEGVEREGMANVRWFGEALNGFAGLPREGALQVVGDIHRRLSLLEDALGLPHRQPPGDGQEATPERIRSLLRGRDSNRPRPKERPPETKTEEKKKKHQDVEEDNGPRHGGRASRPAASAPSAQGLGAVGWGILVGLLGGVLVLAAWQVVLWWRERARQPAPRPAPVTRQEEEPLPRPDERSAAKLWRRAEAAARDGNFREALRWLYLAVLFLLDSRQFLHFEPMRTNGEYLRQIQRSEAAPEALLEPFKDLTDHFDTSWYGEVALEDGDYRELHRLAEIVRENVA